MTDIEYLIKENARLRRENAELQESNTLLSRLLFHASKKLRTYKVPVHHTTPNGRLFFERQGDIVVINYVSNPDTLSNTGDPILDEIMYKRRMKYHD